MSVHVIVLDLLCPGNELLFAVRVKKRTKKRKSQLMFYKSIPYRRISWKVCPKYGNNRHQGYCVGLSLSRKWIPFCCSCKKKTTKKGGLFSRVDQNGVLEKTELQLMVSSCKNFKLLSNIRQDKSSNFPFRFLFWRTDFSWLDRRK